MSNQHEDSGAQFFGATHVGKKRSSNQDNYLIADMRRLLKVCGSSVDGLDGQSVVSNHSGELLMVADGMGGHAHGEYASRAAIQFMTGYVANLMPRFLVIDSSNDIDFLAALKDGPIQIHRLFQKEGTHDPEKAAMGTTLTTAYIVWPFLYVVHVGDTRCYLYRNGNLRQLTTDHTMAQYLADAGELKEERFENANLQNILWNCISAAKSPPEPEVRREMLRTGDLILICSDGLTKHMSVADIMTILASSESVEVKTNQLIEETNRRGGRDNISVVIGAFNGPPDAAMLCHDRSKFKVVETLQDTDVDFTVSP